MQSDCCSTKNMNDKNIKNIIDKNIFYTLNYNNTIQGYYFSMKIETSVV